MSDLELADSGHTALAFVWPCMGTSWLFGLCALVQPWWFSSWP